MTNEELKKKIAQIIADYFCPQGNEHKKLWGDDRLCYSKMNFAECEWVTECTDALISAGIGDLKEHRIFAGKDGSIKQLYSGEEVEKIVKERKELKDELRSKVEYIHEQDEVVKEYKHRAEVAERALDKACKDIKDICEYLVKFGGTGVITIESYAPEQSEPSAYIDRAEKELAEGNGGKKEV